MLFNLNQKDSVNVTEDTRSAKTTATVVATDIVSIALATNANRANYSIYNEGTESVYLREGLTATPQLYDVVIPAGFYWKEDFSGTARYLGDISVITAAGTAVLQVSEGALL